ncbi:MAG: hypothetical protein ACU84J_15260 [Gammaproteobacteria bacterium]
MSAQTIAVREQSAGQLAVSFRVLLGLYSIIPICLLLQGADSLFWQGFLKEHLPAGPKHFFLFQILFGTPHILASTIILTGNTDYLSLYRYKLAVMTLAIILLFGIGSLFIPYIVLYLVAATWTVFHVLKQQFGIARGVCRLPAWAFYLLLGLSVAAGLFVYAGIFLNARLDPQHAEWIRHAAGALCIGLVLSTILCQRYAKTAFGKGFMWSNSLLVVSSFYLYVQQYYFLAILIPRLVHDATAYIFYVTHDYNRHLVQPANFIYRWARRCHVHVFVVLPGLSFLLAFVLQQYGDRIFSFMTEQLFGMEIPKAISLGLIGYFALMHYYTESFTWKNDSPYRQFISFSK